MAPWCVVCGIRIALEGNNIVVSWIHRSIFITATVKRNMSSCHWSNRENYPSSDSSDSSESATYLNLDHSARSSRRSSNCLEYRCNKGHQLLLLPVTFERNTSCGCCSANIRMKPAQVLCYHCNECDYDACGDCVSEDMKETLKDERSRAMVSVGMFNLLIALLLKSVQLWPNIFQLKFISTTEFSARLR